MNSETLNNKYHLSDTYWYVISSEITQNWTQLDKTILNSLTAKVAIILKLVNWFTLQIKWLVSMMSTLAFTELIRSFLSVLLD